MGIDFRLSLRKQLRDPLGNWLKPEAIQNHLTNWLTRWDLYLSTTNQDPQYADNYLDVVRLTGEYLSDRPNFQIAEVVFKKVEFDFEWLVKHAGTPSSPLEKRVHEIGVQCVELMKNSVTRCRAR